MVVVVVVGQAVGVVLLPSARLARSGRMAARRSAGGSDLESHGGGSVCVDMQEQLLQLQLPACDPRVYRIEEFKLLRSMWSACISLPQSRNSRHSTPRSTCHVSC